MRDLRKYGYKRIDILEMQKYLGIDDYESFAEKVQSLCEDGTIAPVKSSRTNGKRPPLYNRYAIKQEEKDYTQFEDELKYKLNYRLHADYYLKHLEQYERDRDMVLKLSSFLNEKKELLDTVASENERSFQIWQREKFLREGAGKTLLKNLGFPVEELNIYPTTEPLAYFSIHKDIPQTILILENMDTFYTMRTFLLNGGGSIFSKPVSTLIYGRGKDIWRTFNDFTVCIEPYLLNGENEMLYFGDMDYEGIYIYQQLKENFKKGFEIKPFKEAYCFMLDKAEGESYELPQSKAGQNKNISDEFFSWFDKDYRRRITGLLESGKYIPQEIISLRDLQEACNEA